MQFLHPDCLKAQLLHDLERSELDQASYTITDLIWRKQRYSVGEQTVYSFLGRLED